MSTLPATTAGAANGRPSVNGIRRAAIVTLLLGDGFTKKMLRLFRADDVRRLLGATKTLQGVTEDEVLVVLEDLVRELEKGMPGVSRHGRRMEEAAVSVFGYEIIRSAQSPEVEAMSRQIHAVANSEPETFARTLQREHPQTIAVMLATLPSDLAAAVLRHLPDAVKAEVVRRVGRLKTVSASVLADVTAKLGHELGHPGHDGPIALDGMETAVKLLRTVGGGQEEPILDALAASDPAMCDALKTRLFTFEDLRFLHDRELQMVLREVDQKSLPLALKTASPEVAARIMTGMSKRAAEMLAEDLQAAGPVTLAQSEAAQRQIVSQVLALAAQGKVNIRPGESV